MTEAAAPAPRSSWIINPAFDLSLFVVPIFLALTYGIVSNQVERVAVIGNGMIYILLGLTHFASTWAFYFDRENLEHFNENKLAFYYIPIGILATAIVLAVFGQSDLIKIITYWFSGLHVMKQSTGFVALYRSRLGIFSTFDRKLDNAAVLGASTYCLFARYADRTDFGYETVLHGPAAGMLFLAAKIGIAVVLLVWAWNTTRRVLAHGASALPLVLASVAAIVMFLPFLYVDDLRSAFMANLVGHYTQYLGLVWIINRRKYTRENVARYRSTFLAAISQNFWVLMLVLVGYALVISAATAVTPVFIGLIWIHFFVDRYLFRFRDPFVRESLLPFLRPSG